MKSVTITINDCSVSTTIPDGLTRQEIIKFKKGLGITKREIDAQLETLAEKGMGEMGFSIAGQPKDETP